MEGPRQNKHSCPRGQREPAPRSDSPRGQPESAGCHLLPGAQLGVNRRAAAASPTAFLGTTQIHDILGFAVKQSPV